VVLDERSPKPARNLERSQKIILKKKKLTIEGKEG